MSFAATSAFSLASSLGSLFSLVVVYTKEFVRGIELYRWYGPSGIALFLFGNRTTWRIQAQILGEVKDEDALAFKQSVYDECTMIAVAAAIVAQIAITGLSLDSLSQTHWVARAGFVLSLTFALMAVYYATTQQRTLGRLLKAKDIRLWIRGGHRKSTLRGFATTRNAAASRIQRGRNGNENQDSEQARVQGIPASSGMIFKGVVQSLLGSEFNPSDPDEYTPDLSTIKDLKTDIIDHCFTPGVASVITISAPQMLLSASLEILLISIGIYFGFLWVRHLDQNTGPNDSRNVFIVYLFGLIVSGFVYSISTLFQDNERRYERKIVEGYLDEYIASPSHIKVVARWGIHAEHVDNGITLTQVARERREHDAEAQHPQRTSLEERGKVARFKNEEMVGSKNIKNYVYLQRTQDYNCETKTASTAAYAAVEAQTSILEAPKSRVVKPNREMAPVKTPSWAFDTFLPSSDAFDSPKTFKPHIPTTRRPISKPPVRNVTAAVTLVSETNRYPSLLRFCSSLVPPSIR